MWIRISASPDPELESESQNGHKSDSGAGSRDGIITPLVCKEARSRPRHQGESGSKMQSMDGWTNGAEAIWLNKPLCDATWWSLPHGMRCSLHSCRVVFNPKSGQNLSPSERLCDQEMAILSESLVRNHFYFGHLFFYKYPQKQNMFGGECPWWNITLSE